MKSMNRREGKKIAVMAAVILSSLVIVFTPLAAATVTNFVITPDTGEAGKAAEYLVTVNTEGDTTIDMTIPAGFGAVTPKIPNGLLAQIDLWNATKAKYGSVIFRANETDPGAHVDVYCNIGGDEATSLNVEMNYGDGEATTITSPFGDASDVTLLIPTGDTPGSLKLKVPNCPIQQVTADFEKYVQNPIWTGIYQFTVGGLAQTVEITGGFPAVFRDGMWYVDTTGDHIADTIFPYGLPTDIALVGDFGSEDIAVVRSVSDLLWWFAADTTGIHEADTVFLYGLDGDTPIVGNIDRAGADDIAVRRGFIWYVDTDDNHEADLVFAYGLPTDIPLVGDINQDGNDDTAVFRNGMWYVDTTDNGNPPEGDTIFAYGAADDTPMVGDIDNDGKDDIAVFRDGIWYVDTDFDHVADLAFVYGDVGDDPLAGKLG